MKSDVSRETVSLKIHWILSEGYRLCLSHELPGGKACKVSIPAG